ncbi:MAG: glycosyltransferase family 2 protein [Actinomycetia bacterium]|nr:glycosyltransferase family 2 protein [Actinomycetes bacterium]
MDRRDERRTGVRHADPGEEPLVSVIMPVLNEERHLRDAVAMVLRQDWAGPLQVVLAVGPSSDRTEEIAADLARADERILVVANPSGRTPDALNAAIQAAAGEIIVRVDGHAEIPEDYISVAVQTLERTGAENVGGLMDAQGITPFQRAVAVAMRSRIGVGNSRFHVGGQAGETDTVYLGVFRREALERVGGYDSSFARAQDWEMNHRIRQSGGLVYFTPELKVTYRPRASVTALAKQYFHYGRWRAVVARAHEGTLNMRYLAPPVMVSGVSAATAVGLLSSSPLRRGCALAVPAAYLAAVVAGGVAISTDEPWSVRARTPVALVTMHWSWGVGFLSSLVDPPR